MVVIPTSHQDLPEEPPLLRTVDLRLGPERLRVRAQSGRTERGWIMTWGGAALNVRSMGLSAGWKYSVSLARAKRN